MAGWRPRRSPSRGGRSATIGAVTSRRRGLDAGPAVDTTGAGDAFAAGLVASLAQHLAAVAADGARAALAAAEEWHSAGGAHAGAQATHGGRAQARTVAMSSPLLRHRGRGASGARRGPRRRRARVEPDRPGPARAAQPRDGPGRRGRGPRVRRGARPRPPSRTAGWWSGPTVLCSSASPTRSAPWPRPASRDLGPLLAAGRWRRPRSARRSASRTWPGIDVFATGGIGGVHRGAPRRRSTCRATSTSWPRRRSPSCARGRSRSSTCRPPLELLETRRVPVVGYGVDELPAFYSSELRPAPRASGRRTARGGGRDPRASVHSGAGGHAGRPAAARGARARARRGGGLDRRRPAPTRRRAAFAAVP